MSPSSAEVSYQPAGAGQRTRTAQFDTSIIPDPEIWLIDRLGPLVRCVILVRSNDVESAAIEIEGEAQAPTSAHTAVQNSALPPEIEATPFMPGEFDL